MDNKLVDKVMATLDKAVVDNIKIYHMENYTPFYDYAIIASASNTRQGLAAMNYVKDLGEEEQIDVRCSAVSADTKWFLIDLKSVVVHVFVGDERQRYNLDAIYDAMPTLKKVGNNRILN